VVDNIIIVIIISRLKSIATIRNGTEKYLYMTAETAKR